MLKSMFQIFLVSAFHVEALDISLTCKWRITVTLLVDDYFYSPTTSKELLKSNGTKPLPERQTWHRLKE